VKELLFNLIDAVSKNGNYLLNVGPTADGEILSPYSTRLIEIGKWLRKNGDAVYGCSGTAFGDEYGSFSLVDGKKSFIHKPADWRSTTKPGKVFIHVFNWPADGTMILPPLNKKIRKARFIDNSRHQLTFTQTPVGITLHLPEKSPDSLLPVLELSY
jgi:alpha-L-fucosidase